MSSANSAFPADRELVLTRLMDATPEQVYRAWTEPELIKEWFAPKPWTTPVVEVEVRAGGSYMMVMRGPEGEEAPMAGLFLEVVPNRRLVFTDAYTKAWEPGGKPFLTGIITMENEGGKTRYTATVRHWSKEDRDAHEIGFHAGWGQCADQLAEVAGKLR